MAEKFRKTLLYFTLALLIINPAPAFAWPNRYYDYHGSGRDHAYSEYINLYYSPEYVSTSSYDPDGIAFINDINYPHAPMLTPATDLYASQLPLLPTNEFTVNIPNKNGSYTSVVIKKSGKGYLGPQGEYYTEFPTVAELKVIYGK